MKNKLTPKLKEQIKKDFKQLKKQDFSGDALKYLNKVKGAAKGRAAKKSKYIQLGKKQVNENSLLGKIIKKSAEIKKTTVKKYVKENQKRIERLGDNYRETVNEIPIDSIAGYIEKRMSNAKTYINGVAFSEVEAIYEIEHLRNRIRRIDSSIMQIFWTFLIDMKGNLYFDIPDWPEDNFQDWDIEDIISYFADYGIKIIISERIDKDGKPPKTRLKRNYTKNIKAKKPKKKK
jgi:hypothetical protein